jgi:RimJ/RimL family protein N-acetyltransferase
MTEVIEKTGHIALIINPEHQNKGHGKKILKKFIDEVNTIINIPINKIHAGIELHNTSSIRCFEACGFLSGGINEDGEIEYIINIKD